MKTFKEITNDITKLSSAMRIVKEKIDTEDNKFKLEMQNMNREEKMKFWNDTADKREQSAKIIFNLTEQYTKQKLMLKLMESNARTTLFYETMPVVIEVWNKYKGKRCGEKTYQKIKDEIFEKTNCHVYLSGYNNDKFSISYGEYYGRYNVDAYTTYEHNVLINNVIQEITMDDFQNKKDYVEDIEKRAEELINKYSEAMKKRKELEAVYDEFNILTVDGIERLYITRNSYSII